jgi:N-acetyl-anhydromuramyl-L-alanine amidase AmpD
MNGLSNYDYYNHSGSVSPLNIGVGRAGHVGALVHTTSGIDSLHWLLSGSAESGQPATADYLIARDGTQYQIVPTGQWGYHAGKSLLIYNSRVYRNDEISRLLMGIELENLDNTQCTYEQHDSLAAVIVREGLRLGWRWPYYLLGHYEVATPMGRRSDPRGFLWGDFMGRLYARAKVAGVAGL